jgi:PAS domain S-box-containing protein
MNASLTEKLSLSSQLQVLVILPFVFELIFCCTMWQLLTSAEKTSEAARYSHALSNTVNGLVRDIYSIELLTSGKTDNAVFVARQTLKDMAMHITNAKSQLAGDRQYELALNKAEQGVAEAKSLLGDYEQQYVTNRGVVPKTFLASMDIREKKALEKMIAIVELARQKRPFADSAFLSLNDELKREAVIKQSIILFVFLSIAISIGAAVFVTRNITCRVALVSDNLLRLGRQLPLDVTIEGNDEIAELDQHLHKVADKVTNSMKTERALIAYAPDVICSIDENGRFTAVNPASVDVFGKKAVDLIGKSYLELISALDTEKIIDAFEQSIKTDAAQTLELQIVKRFASTDVLWTMHWSVEERQMFCVVHDLTETKKAQREKQALIAMLTHDMRSPLTAVQTVIELLDSGNIGNFDLETLELAHAAKSSTTEMMALINDLLDLEKLKAGLLDIHKKTLELARILEISAEAVKVLSGERNIRLVIKPTNLFVNADSYRTTQAIKEIFRLMINTSADQALIDISTREANEWIEIKIESTPSRRRVLSEESQTTPNEFGHVLAREIVLLHGGTVSYSQSKSDIQAITVTLPSAMLDNDLF